MTYVFKKKKTKLTTPLLSRNQSLKATFCITKILELFRKLEVPSLQKFSLATRPINLDLAPSTQPDLDPFITNVTRPTPG